MPDPLDTHRTAANPADLSASAAGDRDDTSPGAPRGGTPHFGPPAAPGEVGTLGPYRVLKELGKGGMGAVYLATDTRLGRKVALKVMLPESAADRPSRERFLREARAAALVAHDHVVTVFEADERDGVPYIAMQLLQGYPLDEYLTHKGLPPLAHVVRIGREAALGLAAAHALGMVHRDVKPANLWLESPNGRVKVLDFGLAKPIGTESELTKSGAVMGTPAYMSPEQARGLKVDARTDLFSLGAVLYRLCTGRAPFAGEHVMAVLAALIADDPPPVRDLNPEVPEPLAQLIHALLAKNPAHRPQTAAEVAEWLRMLLEGTLPPGAEVSASLPAVVAVPLPVPMQVTAAPESAFANLVDEPDVTEATELADPPAPKRGGRGALLGVVGAALLAGAVVAVVASQMGKKPAVTADAPSRAEPGRGPTPPAPTGKKDDVKASNPAAKEVPAKRPPKPWIPPAPVPVGQSPFDKLDPAAIPREERFDWQPKELVAVAGTHSPRTWTGFADEWARSRIAVSDDGNLLAAGGSAHLPLRVWDVKTRAVVSELTAPPDHLHYSPAFSPDGKFLTTYIHHPGRWYYRWNLAEPHRPPVEWVKGLPINELVTGEWHSPDGGRIVVQSNEVTIWDVTVQPPKELFRVPSNAWSDVGVSRDRTRIVSHSAAAKGMVVYDVTATGPKERLVVEADAALCALSPDGSKLVTWRGGELLFWNLAADKPTPTNFAPRSPNLRQAMAFSPDGARLITQDADHCLRLWDTTGPMPQPVWAAPLRLRGFDPARPTRAAFAGADGKTLVAYTGWGLVHFIDASGAEPKVLNPVAPSEPSGPELAIDGTTGNVALGRAEDDRRQFWSFSGQFPVPVGRTAPPGLVAHSPDFRKMAVWEDGRLHVLTDNARTGTLETMMNVGVFSADGRTYWGLERPRPGGGYRGVGWDVSGDRPREVGAFPMTVLHGTAFWLVRNDTVLACLSDAQLTFWDVAGPQPERLSVIPQASGFDLRVFPDGERVLCRGPHAVPQLWRLTDRGWAKMWDDPKVAWPVWAVHPHGRYFAQYAGGEITIRRTADGTVVRAIPFAKSPPMKLEFTPDGRHLFVVNGFNTVYVLRIPGLDADPDRAAAEWALSVGGAKALDVVGAHGPQTLPAGPFTLRRIRLFQNADPAKVTDAGLANIRGCADLIELDLRGMPVSDVGLGHLKGCRGLLQLWLWGTRVTDAGLEHLKECPRLAWLELNSLPITDAGLEHLRGLADLKELGATDTKVTAAGVQKLAAALPNCTIIWNGGKIEPKKP